MSEVAVAPVTIEHHREPLGIGESRPRLSGAEPAGVSTISRPHTVCGPEPWVTGWEFGDMTVGGVVPCHPNAAGRRAVTGLLVGMLSG